MGGFLGESMSRVSPLGKEVEAMSNFFKAKIKYEAEMDLIKNGQWKYAQSSQGWEIKTEEKLVGEEWEKEKEVLVAVAFDKEVADLIVAHHHLALRAIEDHLRM